jgi:hypothetical protein
MCVFFSPFHVVPFPNFSIGNSRIYNRKVFWRYRHGQHGIDSKRIHKRKKSRLFFLLVLVCRTQGGPDVPRGRKPPPISGYTIHTHTERKKKLKRSDTHDEPKEKKKEIRKTK